MQDLLAGALFFEGQEDETDEAKENGDHDLGRENTLDILDSWENMSGAAEWISSLWGAPSVSSNGSLDLPTNAKLQVPERQALPTMHDHVQCDDHEERIEPNPNLLVESQATPEWEKEDSGTPELEMEFSGMLPAVFRTSGFIFQIGERIPLLNNGIQALHELTGNSEALDRARSHNPIGTDGYVTQAAEHLPLLNMVLRELHKTAGEAKALERARVRDPIGPHGLITRVAEHIPVLSDGIMAYHHMQGHDEAAERARGFTLQQLLSKDGTFTKLAELLPAANLIAAAVHEVSGNRVEAMRALDLMESWGQALQADGPCARVAELVPGADALAFAAHIRGGHYAQAIRSITKTAWINISAQRVTLLYTCRSLSQMQTLHIEAFGVEAAPMQLSLLAALSDLLASVIRIIRYQQSSIPRLDSSLARPEAALSNGMAIEVTSADAAALVAEVLSTMLDERIARRLEILKSNVPRYMQTLVANMNNKWFPIWRSRRTLFWLLLPPSMPALPTGLVQQIQEDAPYVTLHTGVLPTVEATKLRKRCKLLLPSVSGASTCLAATGCLGLGVKAMCTGFILAAATAAAALALAATQKTVEFLDSLNSERWDKVTRMPQPEQPPKAPWVPPPPTPSPPEAGNGFEVHPHGIVLEVPPERASRLAGLAYRHWLDNVLRGGLGAQLFKFVEPVLHRLLRSVVEAENAVAPVVCDIELLPWELELTNYSWNINFPAMRMATVLHYTLENGEPRCSRAFMVFPDELIHRLLHCLQRQARDWDLRELSPKFRGFTQPVHAEFELSFTWLAPNVLQLNANTARTRLDLPE